jgi:DNA primase
VATPIDWAELRRATPAGYTITTTPRRLAGKSDPWADMDKRVAAPHMARFRLNGILADVMPNRRRLE